MLFMLHPVSRAKRGCKRRSKRLSRIHMATNLIPPAPRQRKPDWIRVKAPIGAAFDQTRSLMRRLKLATVCEEAACPNIGECWTKKHATVMILCDVCTRACAFKSEEHTSELQSLMRISYAVFCFQKKTQQH